MLTVPTTPRLFEPYLPIPGRWTGVCLHQNDQPRVQLQKQRLADITGTNGAVRFYPVHRPASKNP
jgi:hypothetical protein